MKRPNVCFLQSNAGIETRLIVTEFRNQAIEAQAFNGSAKTGNVDLIPRITLALSKSGLPFVLGQRHFPVKPELSIYKYFVHEISIIRRFCKYFFSGRSLRCVFGTVQFKAMHEGDPKSNTQH